MATRRRARSVALQMLFQFEVSDETADAVVSLYRSSFGEGNLPDEYSIELFMGVASNLSEIDGIIENVSENWRLERMSRVDRGILRIGVQEIVHQDDIPPKVAINEAVELAKNYGTAESASFVNGILDKVAQEFEKDDESPQEAP